jgi:hypothetical protein
MRGIYPGNPDENAASAVGLSSTPSATLPATPMAGALVMSFLAKAGSGTISAPAGDSSDIGSCGTGGTRLNCGFGFRTTAGNTETWGASDSTRWSEMIVALPPQPLTYRELTRLIDDERELNDDDVRHVTRTRGDRRKLNDFNFAARRFTRYPISDRRKFVDVVRRRPSKTFGDARDQADVGAVRSFTRRPVDSRHLGARVQGRVVGKLVSDARRFWENVLAKRALTRLRSDAERFVDTVRFRKIGRTRQEGRQLSDDDLRHVTRAVSDRRRVRDLAAARRISRSRTDALRLVDAVRRAVRRVNVIDSRRLTAAVLRDLQRTSPNEKRLFDDAYFRRITRTSEDARKLVVGVLRAMSRAHVEARDMAVSGTAIRSRLDFEGYASDVPLIELEAHHWSKDDYAALILQIISRGSQEIREF